MTPVQRNCLDFIAHYLDQHRCSPSFQEIADALGLASKSGAHRLVSALLERGYLKQEGYGFRKRSLVIAHDHPTALASIPTSALFAELERRGVSHG